MGRPPGPSPSNSDATLPAPPDPKQDLRTFANKLFSIIEFGDDQAEKMRSRVNEMIQARLVPGQKDAFQKATQGVAGDAKPSEVAKRYVQILLDNKAVDLLPSQAVGFLEDLRKAAQEILTQEQLVAIGMAEKPATPADLPKPPATTGGTGGDTTPPDAGTTPPADGDKKPATGGKKTPGKKTPGKKTPGKKTPGKKGGGEKKPPPAPKEEGGAE